MTVADDLPDCDECEPENCPDEDCESYSCYWPDNEDSHSFYQCSNGTPLHKTCLYGLYWDQSELNCDYRGTDFSFGMFLFSIVENKNQTLVFIPIRILLKSSRRF